MTEKEFLERYGQKCVYNEKTDVQEVESGLAVDLTEALQTGVVRESGSALDNNGIDDPEAVLGRVGDIFDAIEAQRAIKKYGKKATVETPLSTVQPNNNVE